ncbi:hypothetical protein [Domibacillus aminovorans]|uniref:Uncharacterized protein n=1 Tax=Domibacillus aminovorans TaxID=29332 RepID=A0A177L6R5_9BACI|nr:hypothetical protein [Domibacillus aminovorans]OAH61037.1 hypothetical protein AWH49_14085 [Domibacillus aminovorans]
MKKLFTSFVFSFLLFVPMFVSAKEKPQWEVPPEIYSILKEKAGFTVYIHTNKPVDFTNLRLTFREVYKQTPNYILGRSYYSEDTLLITKDGFFAGFTSKEKGAAINPENGSNLWRLVQNSAFDDAWNKDNQSGYFHFAQTKATDLTSTSFPYF